MSTPTASKTPLEALDPSVGEQLLRRLADRDRLRSEATVQADVRQLLLSSGLGLGEQDVTVELETQVGDRRRIDVEVGFTVIEVKKDLRTGGVAAAAQAQLAGYVSTRTEQTGQRYVGVLTDGAEWRAYQLRDGLLAESTRYVLSSSKPEWPWCLWPDRRGRGSGQPRWKEVLGHLRGVWPWLR